MSFLETLLVFGPIVLGFFVAASYAGTMLALKRYHDDETFDTSRIVRVEDSGDGDNETDR